MQTITSYHRPTSIDEAISLLGRLDVTTAVVAGGTALNAVQLPAGTEIVDIQAIVGSAIEPTGESVTFGAMVRLADVVADPSTPPLLAELARREGPNTLRNASTIGGTVARGDWESELLAGLLVHEARVAITGHESEIALPDLFADWSLLDRAIITSVSVATGGETASARTGRTPADTSIVAAAGRIVPGGLRLALTGVADTPILVNPSEIQSLDPPADFRGSSEYRRELAGILTARVATDLGGVS